jgi:hypothetical protein
MPSMSMYTGGGTTQAEIMRLASIAELPAMLREGDLLLLDVDETLVRPEQDATEPWFNAFGAEVRKHNGPRPGHEFWCSLQSVCDVEAPEGPATKIAIAAAAAIFGVECVGLTARGPEIHEETVSQLQRCGVHGVFAATTSYGVLAPPEAPGQPPLTHLGGIIYCSGPRKAAGLCSFEAAASTETARRVVLLDDRLGHCQALLEDCSARGRPFLGLHYDASGAADGAYNLARGWQLLAAVVATHGGRRYLRTWIDDLDAAGAADPSPQSARWPPPAAAGLCLAAAAGAALGVGAGYLFARR